jgi:DHA1 family multidrug resistance protein-like MFS transporter
MMIRTRRILSEFDAPFLVFFLTLPRRNWSTRKKMFVTVNIMLLTFSIYAGSSIYTPSIPGLMQEYNSSLVVATLGLSLFVAFYGLGPMVLVPMQELPSLGRTPVYIGSLFLFGLFTLTSAVAQNMATVLVARALSGFFGSPALSTGGATLADMWPKKKLAYVVGAWSMGAVLGPILAPTIGGYSAMYLGWRWPLWLLFFVSCATWIALFMFLPETLHSNILYKRAARLRALTGREDIKSHGQREQESVPIGQVMKNSLMRPLQLMTDPAPLFLSIYLGLCYGCMSLLVFERPRSRADCSLPCLLATVFYVSLPALHAIFPSLTPLQLFFESFPLVFGDIYHFNLGQQGLSFMGYFVTGGMAYAGYCAYQKYVINPLYDGDREPEAEVRLDLALYVSVLIPISTFFFGESHGICVVD